MAENEIRFIGDLQRVDIRPGDKFVLMVEKPVSAEAAKNIQRTWERFAGADSKLLILDSSVKLGAFGPGVKD